MNFFGLNQFQPKLWRKAHISIILTKFKENCKDISIFLLCGPALSQIINEGKYFHCPIKPGGMVRRRHWKLIGDSFTQYFHLPSNHLFTFYLKTINLLFIFDFYMESDMWFVYTLFVWNDTWNRYNSTTGPIRWASLKNYQIV